MTLQTITIRTFVNGEPTGEQTTPFTELAQLGQMRQDFNMVLFPGGPTHVLTVEIVADPPLLVAD